MEGNNGDGTFNPNLKHPRIYRVQELTIATLLEISRIFKTAGQQFSELGVIEHRRVLHLFAQHHLIKMLTQ